MAGKFKPPYRTGDVVRFVSDRKRPWKKSQEMIVYECNLDSGIIQYSTDIGAWFSHDDLELVRECDAKSFKKLLKSIEDEFE